MATPDARGGTGRTVRTRGRLARHSSRRRALTRQGSAPVQREAADLRRRERRGLFLVRRSRSDLSVHARQQAVRPDLRDEDRRLRAAPRQHRRGPHDVLVLHPGQAARRLRLDAPRRQRHVPPKPDFSRGYVWPVYDTYDIFRANADGTGLTRLTTTPGYDAEATIGRDGRIVFTSVRDGDMEIYSMNADGGDVRRLTNRPGPDGGPFFSADGTQIVFRGRPLAPGPELDDYIGAAAGRALAADLARDLRDERRRQQPAPGHKRSAARTSRRSSRPTARGSSSRRTSTTRAGATSSCISSTSTAPASSA